MSPCHDIYDAVAPARRRRSAQPALTQCHDVYPPPVAQDEDEKVAEAVPERQPEFA